MDSYKNYYKILGVAPEASKDELKSAFRKKARMYSPDVNRHTSATEIFEEILEAWGVLSDPAKRKSYDTNIGLWQNSKSVNNMANIERNDYKGYSKPEQNLYNAAEKKSEPPKETAEPVRNKINIKTKDQDSQHYRSGVKDANHDISDYFGYSRVSHVVFSSIILLFCWNIWIVHEDISSQSVVKCGLLAVVFGSLFWLLLWGVRFYILPKNIRKGNGAALLNMLFSFFWGAFYAVTSLWFLEGSLIFVYESFPLSEFWIQLFLRGGGFFALIFIFLTQALEEKGLFSFILSFFSAKKNEGK